MKIHFAFATRNERASRHGQHTKIVCDIAHTARNHKRFAALRVPHTWTPPRCREKRRYADVQSRTFDPLSRAQSAVHVSVRAVECR